MDATPMFPLGTVLLPRMLLPLQVFEPRYLVMLREVLEGDGRFGVVLIERGHEVGGGDVRVDVGTMAEILRAEELGDGRMLVVAVGTSRFDVDRWLPDDPYPRACLTPREDLPAGPGCAELVPEVSELLHRVVAMEGELEGDDPPAADEEVELADDPALASHQAAVLAPIGAWDRLRVLRADRPEERLRIVRELLAEQEEVLRFRLSGA